MAQLHNSCLVTEILEDFQSSLAPPPAPGPRLTDQLISDKVPREGLDTMKLGRRYTGGSWEAYVSIWAEKFLDVSEIGISFCRKKRLNIYWNYLFYSFLVSCTVVRRKFYTGYVMAILVYDFLSTL